MCRLSKFQHKCSLFSENTWVVRKTSTRYVVAGGASLQDPRALLTQEETGTNVTKKKNVQSERLELNNPSKNKIEPTANGFFLSRSMFRVRHLSDTESPNMRTDTNVSPPEKAPPAKNRNAVLRFTLKLLNTKVGERSKRLCDARPDAYKKNQQKTI